MSKPLVTLTVICYQAEKFIKEAIEGALSQTYSPLEIIFSDDASSDKTFSIIKESVKDYSGPHKIILNRNDVNIGIGAHVSRVWFDIASGDWIVVSAGDDISLPHRIERMMQIANDRIGALHHPVIPIDEDSNHLPQFHSDVQGGYSYVKFTYDEMIRRGYWLKGASMCLNKKMLLKYGRLNNDIVNEDNILAYRSAHFGGVIYIDEHLMKYRIHPKSISNINNINDIQHYIHRVISGAKSVLAINKQILDDAKKINLQKSTVKFLRKKNRRARIDLWIFNSGQFELSFIFDTRFFIKILKRIFIKFYWKNFIYPKEISVY